MMVYLKKGRFKKNEIRISNRRKPRYRTSVICLKLAEMGYHILINYQSNNTEAEATLQQIREQGSDGELMKFDVTDAAATHAALNGLDGTASRYLH